VSVPSASPLTDQEAEDDPSPSSSNDANGSKASFLESASADPSPGFGEENHGKRREGL
jgi:hypothetical protein